MNIKIAIPHFFNEGLDGSLAGYGSGRKGNRLHRSLALSRCIGALIALNRSGSDWILNISKKCIDNTPKSAYFDAQSIATEIHVFVTGDSYIEEILHFYAPFITLHKVSLDDPHFLALSAAHFLINSIDGNDIALYLEDDLVINDYLFFDKMAWFHQQTQHKFCLMPHRKEISVSNSPRRLFVDGPISMDGQSFVSSNKEVLVGNGCFGGGHNVEFVKASNPHSGIFCLSNQQSLELSKLHWPPKEFVGPLETAATGTILQKFPIFKPSWACRDFLSVEHGNPSFLGYINKWPTLSD